MAVTPLAGKKVAVVVESQYIPARDQDVIRNVSRPTARPCDLVSRLWGQPSGRFYSTVEPDGQGNVPPLEWLEVSKDFDVRQSSTTTPQ